MDIDADSRSVVAADFDRDGAPDLLVASAGGGAVRLFRNRFPAASRVRIDLVGSKSNRLGIGTRIIAQTGGRTIRRVVFPANGGFGQGPAEVHIGVGSATTIDRLTVSWPAGGEQVFRNGPVNVALRITEDGDSFTPSPLRPGGE